MTNIAFFVLSDGCDRCNFDATASISYMMGMQCYNEWNSDAPASGASGWATNGKFHVTVVRFILEKATIRRIRLRTARMYPDGVQHSWAKGIALSWMRSVGLGAL